MPLDKQPVLEGRLVELRPLRSEDYDDLRGVAADPLIWEQHPDKSRCVENNGGVLGARPDAEGQLVYRITGPAFTGSTKKPTSRSPSGP